jgi:hypothetical protein
MADTNRNRLTNDLSAVAVQEIVRRWPQSGETQRRYCARHGISLSTFAYWRRRQAGDCARRSPSAASVAPTLFREVVITDAPATTADAAAVDAHAPWAFEVALPTGVIVRFGNAVESKAVPAILQAVVAAC